MRKAETASTASTISGAATPLTTESDPVPSKLVDTESTGSESEDDRDLDPRLLIDRYIKLKSRLYKRRPELTEITAPSKKGSKSRQITAALQLDSKCARLLNKLRRLESDILFDQDAALDRWRDIRVQLVRDAAERKKLQIDTGESASRRDGLTTRELLQPVHTTETEGEIDLGDFFSSLPDEQTDSAGKNTLTTTNNEGRTVTIRDFGEWSGMNPRRVLEETCRARDASSKVVYSLISESSFSIRYCIKIIWSKFQDLPDETILPGFVCRADSRNVLLEMDDISTPSKQKSEAFISVTALFLIFIPSVTEEKAHLRLPSVWRDVWAEFREIREQRLDHADRAEVSAIRKLVERDWHAGAAQKSEMPLDEKRNADVHGGLRSEDGPLELAPSLDPIAAKSLWMAKSSTPAYQKILTVRKSLPMWGFKGELLKAVRENQVVIVCGETGCGKSTQTPSFLLESELSEGRYCKIYCTEPRRISAISLARRVSEELGERKMDVGTSRSLVGYAIRLESHISHTTKLVYATTGIVMRMLENGDGFEQITHIVLDEVHERTIDSDFLLIVLRKLMVQRPSLKVILMSATVNAEQFSRYLNNAPILNVPGRTFPVEVKYLEDAVEIVGQYTNLQSVSQSAPEDLLLEEEDLDDTRETSTSGGLDHYSSQTRKFLSQFNEYRIDFGLVARLLEVIASQAEYANYSKAILVFLPGLAEIRRLNDMLLGSRTFSKGWQLFPLHSTIATEAQEAAFHIPPPGIRKVVLATNIAETGITIPDITCVVDLGKHREMR